MPPKRKVSLKRADTLDLSAAGPSDGSHAAPYVPGGPMDIVFSFDTTYSMRDVLKEVRAKVQEVITRLFTDMPNLQIGVIAHADYDSDGYITKYMDLSNDVTELQKFVSGVEDTAGWTVPECYELVLQEAREKLSWRPGSQRALVMIGDTMPHDKHFYTAEGKDFIDWKDEVLKLRKTDVTIYGVQAYEYSKEATKFWTDLSATGGGKHLNLKQFESIVDIMMGICYREQGPEMFEAYEKEVRAREGAGIRDELHNMLLRLKDRSDSVHSVSEENAVKMVSGVASLTKSRSSLKRAAASSDDDNEDEVRPKAKKTKVVKIVAPPTTARARTTKAAAASQKRATQKKKQRIQIERKLRREEVPENNFMLAELQWTPWRMAGQGGSVSHVFVDDTEEAVYELAVQARERTKKFPVFYSTTNGKGSTKDWQDRLLNGKAKSELNRVMKKNCKVFLRRAQVTKRVKVAATVVENVGELKELIDSVYDYPWCNDQDNEARVVTKSGVLISSGSD